MRFNAVIDQLHRLSHLKVVPLTGMLYSTRLFRCDNGKIRQATWCGGGGVPNDGIVVNITGVPGTVVRSVSMIEGERMTKG